MRRILSLVTVAVLATAACASTDAYNGKVSAPLKMLLTWRQAPADKVPANLRNLISSNEVNVSVRLTSPRDPAVWESRGLRLRKLPDGHYAGLAGIYGAHMTWDEIKRWADDPGILQIESDWWPGVIPCLDLSAPEVGADQCWDMSTPQGFPITGAGQLVADFDTGIDVFHPAFFRPSTLRFDWLDIDLNGVLTPAVDCVDMNHNGIGEREELLRLLDGQIYDSAKTFGTTNPSNNDGIYQANWDWLYDDLDDDNQRDYGTSGGFTENTLSYGEPVFYSDDVNHNNSLDIGEQLIQLGTSKVRAVMANSVFRRGINLIQAPADFQNHGTGVSGILVGGEPGRSRFCGLAPGADLLMGYTSFTWFEEYLPWVYNEGCKILLYEFGGWVFNPLDGSSLEEALLDSMAGLGVMQVTPSGNLNRGFKHCQLQIAPGSDVPITVGAVPYLGTDPTYINCSFLWREPATDLSVSLQDPYGLTLDLAGDESIQYFGGWTVSSGQWVSPRGTAMYYFWIDDNEPVSGNWEFILHRLAGGSSFEVNGYVQDDASAWGGGVEFTDFRSSDKTVTWPATADSAFVLGSYSTRGYEQYLGQGSGSIQPGMISLFSGRGTRIDGMHILSITSPGNYDVYTTRSKYDFPYTHGGWRQFSGTSAAGPHVAASAVLARQADTTLSRRDIEGLLEAYAFRDNFTGPDYNDTWGYGKVRINNLVSNLLGVLPDPGKAVLPTSLGLLAYPNPFNAVVSLRVDLPRRQHVKLTAWNLLGRKVADLYEGEMEAGSHPVAWNATGMPSGIYWVKVKSGDRQVAQKVALLK